MSQLDILTADEIASAEALDAAMIAVPAGRFLMGEHKRRMRVAAFRIDRYPVTNLQYRRFVAATGHAPPAHWQGGKIPEGKALHPVVHVTWHDAVAYAAWAGKRLPTEDEWEKAARGTDGREYPWGDWAEGRCNTAESNARDTTPVGHFSPDGNSPYGCADMAGNVWEWTALPWDPIHPSRVLRGGSWGNRRQVARCACRSWNGAGYSNDHIGFRCAATDAP